MAVPQLAADGKIDEYPVLGNAPPGQGKIATFQLSRSHLPGELAVGGFVLGDDQQARGVPVEPVHDAGSLGTGSGGEGADAAEQGVHQGSRGAARTGMSDHALGLVDDGQVLVLEQDFERCLLGGWKGIARGREGGLHPLPR